MTAAFLPPREAVEAGVPKTSAHRLKDALATAVQGQILVVDGAAVTTPEVIAELLNTLAMRASAAEEQLARVQQRVAQLDQDLQLARHELDVQRARAKSFSPRLAAVAAQVAQLLDETLNAPESKLTD